MEIPRFIGVEALLEDIGRGIGKAAQEVTTTSRSVVGALAVKTAEVNVTFEMTSAAARRGTSAGVDAAPLLGAKTLSITSDSAQEAAHNRCSITLSLVSVALPPDEKPLAVQLSGLMPGTDRELRAAVGAIRDGIARAQVSTDARSRMTAELDGVEAQLRARKLDAARTSLAQFAGHYVSLSPSQP